MEAICRRENDHAPCCSRRRSSLRSSRPQTAPPEAVETYVVRAGDTLSRIAGKVYGDVSPRSRERIYQEQGGHRSRISVGMELTIPQ